MDCVSRSAVPLAYSVFDFNTERRVETSPVVILHSLFSNRKTWEYIANEIAKQTRKTVYTVDIRNHGDSPYHDKGDMRYDYASDLKLFLQTRGISKCHFIGHSLGGKLELLLSFEKPELVESLILVDIVPLPTPEVFCKYMRKITKLLQSCIEELNESNISKFEVAKSFCEEELKSIITLKSFRDTLVRGLKMSDKGYEWNFNIITLEQHYDYMEDFDTTDQVFLGPTLVIAPDNSGLVTPQDLKNVYSVLPNMRSVRIPNVSHHLHLEAPDKVIASCLDFWSKMYHKI